MKKTVYTYPKSGFLSLEKDMALIVDMILKNNRLKKMLYYTTKDCLNKDNLTDEQTLELFGKNIRIIPKIIIDGVLLNYIIISFDDFVENIENPEFRNNIIEFDIICEFDQWHMKDFELRPYKIAAELDSMLNNQHLSGIGTLKFHSASQMLLDENYGGVCLKYYAIHGEEDRKNMPNPIDEQDFIENFNEIFNN